MATAYNVTLPSTTTIKGLLVGTQWVGAITYNFPTSSSYFPTTYGSYNEHTNNFEAASAVLQSAVTSILQTQYAAVSNLSFTQSSNTASVDMTFAMSDAGSTAWGYYPSNNISGGDVWFNTTYGGYSNPTFGSYAYATVLHEIGHALGLKHGHASSGSNTAVLPYSTDSMEYSVMTYRSYVGGPVTGYTNATGHYAQSLMMYDIQAIQYLYGANFTTNGSDSTYTFNSTTGEMSINGVGQGASSANVVFRTVWDGNGNDTYNLSNYTTNLTLSLVPGAYSNFGTQLALLHYDGSQVARGNLFNAMQYYGEIRSLIENAIGGSGNDTITGNIANNVLQGGAGNDSLDGGAGDDVLIGGIGIDTLVGGSGNDVYYINDNANDVIIEGVNGGVDTVYDSVGIGSLGANIDNVVMYGNSAVMVGNSLDNVFTATSRGGGVTIDGGSGNDVFYTSNYSDSLTGGAGNDIFISYYSVDGADSLYGGLGDDAYYLFETDTVYWENVGEGYDILFTQVNVTLAANNSIDYIYNYGAANYAVGNAFAQVLSGYNSSLSQTLDGAGGNDVIYGSHFSDSLIGGSGNDILFGYEGSNTLIGGTGDDVYYIESATDTLVENASEGYDVVYSSVSYTLANNLEYLLIYGAATTGIGNGGNNILNGYNSALAGVTLDGAGGDDVIYGSRGSDLLIGGAGNDIILGTLGADTYRGGTGDDVYHIEGLGSTVIENAGEGTDAVYSYINITQLYDNVETLVALTGVTVANGNGLNNLLIAQTGQGASLSGFAGNDVIVGSAYGDTLIGGLGADTMTGGAGNDQFVFLNPADTTSGERDVITDFTDGQDLITVTGSGLTAADIGSNIVITQQGADTLVTFISPGYAANSSILLQNFTAANLTAGDFLF